MGYEHEMQRGRFEYFLNQIFYNQRELPTLMEVTRCHPMPMPMPYGEARDISISAAEICSHILVCTQSIPGTLGILEDKFKTEKLKTLHVESWA